MHCCLVDSFRNQPLVDVVQVTRLRVTLFHPVIRNVSSMLSMYPGNLVLGAFRGRHIANSASKPRAETLEACCPHGYSENERLLRRPRLVESELADNQCSSREQLVPFRCTLSQRSGNASTMLLLHASTSLLISMLRSFCIYVRSPKRVLNFWDNIT